MDPSPPQVFPEIASASAPKTSDWSRHFFRQYARASGQARPAAFPGFPEITLRQRASPPHRYRARDLSSRYPLLRQRPSHGVGGVRPPRAPPSRWEPALSSAHRLRRPSPRRAAQGIRPHRPDPPGSPHSTSVMSRDETRTSSGMTSTCRASIPEIRAAATGGRGTEARSRRNSPNKQPRWRKMRKRRQESRPSSI